MCGISGYFGKSVLEQATLKKTLDLMKYRGPDFQASIKNIKKIKIYLFIIVKGKEKKFYKYLRDQNCNVLKWLSR